MLTAENKAEYVERLTACALHNKYLFVESSDLVGSAANPAIIIPPVGTVSATSSPLPLNKLPVIVVDAVIALVVHIDAEPNPTRIVGKRRSTTMPYHRFSFVVASSMCSWES